MIGKRFFNWTKPQFVQQAKLSGKDSTTSFGDGNWPDIGQIPRFNTLKRFLFPHIRHIESISTTSLYHSVIFCPRVIKHHSTYRYFYSQGTQNFKKLNILIKWISQLGQ